jgi:hypothetical protein
MPPIVGPNYPSLETIANTVRGLMNDVFAGFTSTPGEGQIVTDHIGVTTTNNPLLLNNLNAAIRELYRKLRNVGTPTLLNDNYILYALPPLDSPTMGVSVPDPTVQTYLNNSGYFDGVTLWNPFGPGTNYTLPSDMLMPLVLYERATNSNNPFSQMTEAPNGLPSGDQNQALNLWEWRGDVLYFPGATIQRDLRIRYRGILPQFFTADLDFSTTFVPIMDCEDFVAYATCERISLALGGQAVTAAFTAKKEDELQELKNEQVKRMQQHNYQRRPFNNENSGDVFDEFGF